MGLIAVSLVALGAVIAITSRAGAGNRPPQPAGPRQPDLASTMDWISDREGWVSALDRQAGTTDLFHTTDAGRHWSRQRVSASVETVDFFDSLHGVLSSLGPLWQSSQPSRSGPAVGTLRTDDGGRHWQRLALPSGAGAQQPTFADARHGWVWDPSPAGLYATADGGAHWRRLAATGLPGRPAVLRLVGFRDARRGWLTAQGVPDAPTLYGTADGGASWSAIALPAPAGGWPAGDQFQVGPMTIAPDGRGQLLVSDLVPWGFGQVVSTRWVAATADAGATWSVPRAMPDAGPGTAVRVATSRADGWASWAWSADELLTTRDGGGHWTRLTVPQGWTIHRLQPIDAATAWVAASVSEPPGDARWSLFSTGDGGGTWTPATVPALT